MTLVHILGVVIGLGSAFAADSIFFLSIRDRIIDENELRRLKRASAFVWLGVAIIVSSGAYMFLQSPAEFLHYDKFLAKFSIVALVIINGAVFHFIHLPYLQKNIGNMLSNDTEFGRKSLWLFVSGGVSTVSWLSALALGWLRNLPYSYSQIMLVYLAILVCSITGALILRKLLLKNKTNALHWQRG
jgi:hypothetical protein